MDVTERGPFGGLLRVHRVAAGLSQEELAERARLSQRTISDLERGVTNSPYPDTVARLADALELGASDRAAMADAVHRARSSSSVHQRPGGAPVDPLLATKLAIPPARGGMVPRPRLVEQLQAGLRGPLTLLSAPAGSGKTSLLSAWRASPEGRDVPLAWVSLDEADNDPTRFWRYVLTALDRAAPGMGAGALTLLRSSDAPSMETVLGTLVNAVSAYAGDVVLILDDYHLIESAPIHRMLALLIERLPPCLHLLLATRADPSLPLARLRARADVTELRAADLRFHAEETAAFLRTVTGLSLSLDEIAALEARTEGWIAGLRLAGLSLQGRFPEEAAKFIAAFTGSHRYIVDYLLDEVLLRQPEHLRRFLLHTCILERLCAPLCAAVLDGENTSADRIGASQEALESLERNNVFLIALDDDRRWYRYHYLFADVLRLRPREASSERVVELHRRAAVWCRAHGLVHDALRHAKVANEPEWAAELVEDSVDDVLGVGEGATLRGWLSALPEAVVRSRPRLCLAQAIVAFNAGRLEEIEPLLDAAEHGLNVQPDRLRAFRAAGKGALANVPALVANLRASLAWARGDTDEAIRLAEVARAHLSEDEREPGLSVRWNLALANWMRGHVVDAERAFAEIVEVGRSIGSTHLALSAGAFLGRVQRSEGMLGAALRTYREGLDLARGSGHPVVASVGTAHVGLAGLLYERDHLDEALRHVDEGIALCEQLTSTQALASGIATLAWIRRAMGDSDGAMRAMDEARRVLPDRDVVSLYNPVPAEWARLLLARGDVEEAASWCLGRGLRETDEVVYAREPEYLVLARVLLAREAPDRALDLLARIGALAEAQGRMASVLEAYVLQALGFHAIGDRSGALDALARALALGYPEGYVRTFADEGPAMASLLGGLLRSTRKVGGRGSARVPEDYLGRVLRAARTSHTSARSTTMVEVLTNRELEVLAMLAAGKRNQEIADELVVTLDTVKKHVTHTIEKLGAANRGEAVARAKQLGLLR